MLAIFVINSLLVTAAVLIHYEVLRWLTVFIPRLPVQRRLRVLAGVFGCLFAHVAEVWLFAIGYYVLITSGQFGTLKGNYGHSLLDCSYFSFTTYTSLGFGDIEPFGNIRFLAGLEALTGLVLITWTASFMYIEMLKYFDNQEEQRVKRSRRG